MLITLEILIFIYLNIFISMKRLENCVEFSYWAVRFLLVSFKTHHCYKKNALNCESFP